MRRAISLIAAASVVLFFASAFAGEARSDWQREWDKILQAARKEAQVTVYISGYEAVLPEFEKEYPDIKLL